MTDDDYSLAHSDIITKLKDRDWFINCVRQTYLGIAKNNGFDVTINNLRVREAHGLWLEDLKKLLDHGIEDSSEELDIYKHAGFLSYWLRRRLVIHSVEINNSDPTEPTVLLKDHEQNLPKKMSRYFHFQNERSAFEFGIQLCLNHKINELKDDEGYTSKQIDSYLEEIARKTSIMVWDTSVLMKQKSVSPHTLYLVFKCLFLH